MEFIHFHVVGNHDNLYKPNNEFIIDKNSFNNRLYNRINNMSASVSINNFSFGNTLVNEFKKYGYEVGKNINLAEIISYVLLNNCSDIDLIKVLKEAQRICAAQGINTREMAMEEYRKNNCPEKPSRLHSLFACTDNDYDNWKKRLVDPSVDAFKIEVYDENPFVSNECLLPFEDQSYEDKVKYSQRYFNPRMKDLANPCNEYLIQGRVRVLEKLEEIRR